MKKVKNLDPRLPELAAILDSYAGYYETRGASSFQEYLGAKLDRADEETLVEPLLARIIERVLGFPPDQYVPQLSKSGLKPDFTPRDLIAHSYVLDAKATDQSLATHVLQIRGYVDQRALRFGVLFNLREMAVYARGAAQPDPDYSFKLLPLWQLARGEAMAGPEYERFLRFCDDFAYRDMSTKAKIEHVRRQEPWPNRLAHEPTLTVDVEFLVEQLRHLSRELAADAGSRVEDLRYFLQLNPAREKRLLDELRILALELAPGTDTDQLPDTVTTWRAALGLAERVWRQYLLRVAYLALTRVLLYRAWEDVEFVDSFLFDGGFDHAYERLSDNAEAVLREAFKEGSDRYRWLYGSENNYDWYRPSEGALVDLLYYLAPVPLGRLDADVLGGLYVSYVDEIDRDRLGQFFTPRSVVRFMLDRSGFVGPNVFRVEGDERKPRRVLDFATGSGGFLVEAARRVIDDVPEDDADALKDALAAIATGFVGGEISPFPYYLTEVNLLLQVSRLLGRLRLVGDRPGTFVLGVLHVDTLQAKSHPAASIEGMPAEHRSDQAELTELGFDLAELDGEKRERFRDLRADSGFELVVGNPPYVSEANNKPLFDRLRSIDSWSGIYRGKTDYFYYFLWLAVEKLEPGGRLCVITPAGWMNAGAADFLREKLLAELRLDELFLFGSYRLFAADQGPAPTPTVESAILVATKAPADAAHKLRVVALEDEAKWPDREALLDEMQRRAKGKSGRRSGLHAHDLRQADLRAEWPWPVKFGQQDVATRVVKHLQAELEKLDSQVEPLEASWKVFTGIETAADAYTRRIDRRLTPDQRDELQRVGKRIGDPILELPPGSELAQPWISHPEVLAKTPESRAVLYGALDDADHAFLLRLGSDKPPRAVEEALAPWKPILATRAEIARNARRNWWETAWPRDPDDLRAPKVMTLFRTDRGRFALDEKGEWQPGKKLTVVVGRSPNAAVAYLCGVLNSELLDLWYAVRGKTPRDVWRNYEPKRMNEMPYRRPEGDPRADEIADIVRQIAANRRALLPHRALVVDLARTVKDPWRSGSAVVDESALISALPPVETVTVRRDATLSMTGTLAGKAIRRSPILVVFRRGRHDVGQLAGPAERLDLLERLLAGKSIRDAATLLLPKDVDALALHRIELEAEVAALLVEGRSLVEKVERLVCALYDVPVELTDAVVAHADARAANSGPTED